jgi:AMP nucleosidase
MKDKSEIVRDWLPRYTGRELHEFGSFVLLVNFSHYVDAFVERFGVPVHGDGFPIQSATFDGVTILNFGMGSAMAATVMDSTTGPARSTPRTVGCGMRFEDRPKT